MALVQRAGLPQWYGPYSQMLDDGGDMHRMVYEYPDGTVTYTDFSVFAGIHLGLLEVDTRQAHSITPLRHDVLEIVHCCQGRCEWELARDACVCIAEGDFAVISTSLIPGKCSCSFPFCSFLGLGIVIDPETLNADTRRLLASLSIDLDRLSKNLRLQDSWFTAACGDTLESAFMELYSAIRADDRASFRLKVLELLFLLQRFHADGVPDASYRSGSCARTVRQMRDCLVANLEQRTSLADLAQSYGISLTLFQNTFKDIYGLSPYCYLKRYKMHQAANRLLSGRESVAEISQSLGYRNASKFTSAFRDVLGTTPREYRKAKTVLEQ